MTLEQANKNIDKSKNFYRLYIKQMVDLHTGSKLCGLLNADRSYIINVLKRDNTMALYRLANQIDKVLNNQAIARPIRQEKYDRN